MSTTTTTTISPRLAAFRTALPTAMSATVGALLAAFLLAAVYIAPESGPRFWVGVSAAYGALMIATMSVFAVHAPKLPKAWAVRFAAGLVVSIVLFLGALFFSFQSVTTSPLVWVPVAIIVALPVAVAGRTR